MYHLCPILFWSYKIYKISSTNFEYKPEKDKSESKVLIDILKIAKKKYKDLLRV